MLNLVLKGKCFRHSTVTPLLDFFFFEKEWMKNLPVRHPTCFSNVFPLKWIIHNKVQIWEMPGRKNSDSTFTTESKASLFSYLKKA